jgi:hypothetical protein
LQLIRGIARNEVMSFCTYGLKGDVFSWDTPRKGDVLQPFSASLQKLQGDGWR